MRAGIVCVCVWDVPQELQTGAPPCAVLCCAMRAHVCGYCVWEGEGVSVSVWWVVGGHLSCECACACCMHMQQAAQGLLVCTHRVRERGRVCDGQSMASPIPTMCAACACCTQAAIPTRARSSPTCPPACLRVLHMQATSRTRATRSLTALSQRWPTQHQRRRSRAAVAGEAAGARARKRLRTRRWARWV
jgi:hypothetical protein